MIRTLPAFFLELELPVMNKTLDIKTDSFTACFSFYLNGAAYENNVTLRLSMPPGSGWVDLSISVDQCFDDCLISFSYETSAGLKGSEDLGRMIMPSWLYACAGFDKRSKSFVLSANNSTLKISLGSNIFEGINEFSVKLTQWDNPGKFGLFNIYAGNEFIPCNSTTGPIYAWNKTDWRIDENHKQVIMSRPVYKSEICNKEKILLLTFPSTWEKTSEIATLLGGLVVNFQHRTNLQAWLRSIGVKGVSQFIWSGKMDGNISDVSWSNGYPKDYNSTNDCIFCYTSCYQTACNFKWYSLIAMKEDRHFTLR